jgi:hypothetical protein
MSATDINTLTQTLHNHSDVVERFLALYDLNRLMVQGTPTVAEAVTITAAMHHAEENDRSPDVQAWAGYYRRRLLGEIPPEPKPFLPRLWRLLLVEEA